MKLGYTLLYVDDVEKTVAFYEAAFGLQKNFIHENSYGEMDTGTTKLGFVAHSLARSNGVEFRESRRDEPAPAVEIAFITDDVPGAYDRAVLAGAEAVAPAKQKPWGQTVAYVRDRNGFLVELCTPLG